jgi:hypothetical protein
MKPWVRWRSAGQSAGRRFGRLRFSGGKVGRSAHPIIAVILNAQIPAKAPVVFAQHSNPLGSPVLPQRAFPGSNR